VRERWVAVARKLVQSQLPDTQSTWGCASKRTRKTIGDLEQLGESATYMLENILRDPANIQVQELFKDYFKVETSFAYISGHPLWFSVFDRSGTKISSTRHDNWSMERVARSPGIMNEAQSSRGTSIGRRLVK
jgi:hypothetical protein